MPRAKGPKALKLGEESWGDRLHRAYRTQRALTGETYVRVAERISQVLPTSEPSLTRLESLSEIPKTARGRLLAYLTVLAYGFNPEEFGLSKENVPLGGYDESRVADLLKRTSRCSYVAA